LFGSINGHALLNSDGHGMSSPFNLNGRQMKAVPLPTALFTLNRERMVKRLLSRPVAALNANDIMPMNADSLMGHHRLGHFAARRFRRVAGHLENGK
jgi:hypothetical protein